MKLYIEFGVLLFPADDEKYKVRDRLTVVMKWVVIHGCFLCLGVLYCQRRGHPSLALHHLQDVPLLFARPCLPASNRLLGKDIQTHIRKEFLWKSVWGSLRGCNCYKNISISKVGCRQKASSFYNLRIFQVCERGRKHKLQMNDVA